MFKEYKYNDDLYYVYDDGRVYDVCKNKFVNQFIDSCGYKVMYLGHSNSNRKKVYVHRIIAECFVENNSGIDIEKLTVNHKDFNKTNNNYTNLEWMTREENASDSYRQSSHKNIGESNIHSKLKKSDVQEIKKLLDKYSDKEIADMYNVDKTTIYDIRNKRSWKYV